MKIYKTNFYEDRKRSKYKKNIKKFNFGLVPRKILIWPQKKQVWANEIIVEWLPLWKNI